jgi:Type II secretion system protein C
MRWRRAFAGLGAIVVVPWLVSGWFAEPGEDSIPVQELRAAIEPAFQTSAAPVATPSSPALPMPEPALRVLGVATSASGNGWALVASGDGPAQVLALGASTAQGITLIALAGDRVRFREATGREFSLALEAPPAVAPLAVAPPPTAVRATGIVSRDPADDVSPIVPPDVGMRAPTVPESATPGSYWSRLRDGQTDATAEAHSGASTPGLPPVTGGSPRP